MARRATRALALLGAVLGVGCDGADPHPVPSLSDGYFGINAQLVRELSLRGGEGLASRHLDSIQELGVSFVRDNTDWVSLEPAPPRNGRRSYDYSLSDRWVRQLARRGLRWQPTVIGVTTPQWAASRLAYSVCAERSPPGPAALADLVAGLARRYGRGGSFWSEHPRLRARPVIEYEVWNEPNHGGFWCPAPDPAAYARVFLAADEAVEGVDPRARVLLGGLAGFEVSSPTAAPPTMAVGEFVSQMVAAEPELTAAVDRIGLHPYASDPAAVLDRIRGFATELRALGLRAPIAVNEIGWPTQGTGSVPPLEEAVRAAYVGEVVTSIPKLDCGVDSIAPHTWVTPELDPSDPEHWFGIASPTTTAPYPTAQAYAERIDLLSRGATTESPVGTVTPCPER